MWVYIAFFIKSLCAIYTMVSVSSLYASCGSHWSKERGTWILAKCCYWCGSISDLHMYWEREAATIGNFIKAYYKPPRGERLVLLVILCGARFWICCLSTALWEQSCGHVLISLGCVSWILPWTANLHIIIAHLQEAFYSPFFNTFGLYFWLFIYLCTL